MAEKKKKEWKPRNPKGVNQWTGKKAVEITFARDVLKKMLEPRLTGQITGLPKQNELTAMRYMLITLGIYFSPKVLKVIEKLKEDDNLDNDNPNKALAMKDIPIELLIAAEEAEKSGEGE